MTNARSQRATRWPPSGRRVWTVKATLRRWVPATIAMALALCCLTALGRSAHALSADVQTALKSSQYVYIASNRKDGSFGKLAEIWFMYHRDAVWVASRTTTWRVRRIGAGRPKVRIAVGKRDGPTFVATGSTIADPKLYEEMYRVFAKKYLDGWPKYEERFRTGLGDGTMVLLRYQPKK